MGTSMGPGSVTEWGLEMAVESTKQVRTQNWTMDAMMERMTAQLETAGASKLGNAVVVKGGLA